MAESARGYAKSDDRGADLIVGGTLARQRDFLVGANGHVLTVSGGGLTWQSPTISTSPSVNNIDFTVSVDQPTPPVGHVTLSADATSGVGLTIVDPTGTRTRLGDIGAGLAGIRCRQQRRHQMVRHIV